MSRPVGTSEELERRRRRAVDLGNRGERPSVVARCLGVDRNSVYRWRRQATTGPMGLAARPHPHRPSALTAAQLSRLEVLLAQGAPAHGWVNGLWTAARVADLIERHFARRFHHDHVGRFLRQRLGWTPQRPVQQSVNRDEAAIASWVREAFPAIMAAAAARGADVAFVDEAGFRLEPTVRRTYA